MVAWAYRRGGTVLWRLDTCFGVGLKFIKSGLF